MVEGRDRAHGAVEEGLCQRRRTDRPVRTLASAATPPPATPPCSRVESPPPPRPTAQAIIKPQYVDHIPKAVKGKVGELLTKKDERGKFKEALDCLDLHNVLDRNIEARRPRLEPDAPLTSQLGPAHRFHRAGSSAL